MCCRTTVHQLQHDGATVTSTQYQPPKHKLQSIVKKIPSMAARPSKQLMTGVRSGLLVPQACTSHLIHRFLRILYFGQTPKLKCRRVGYCLLLLPCGGDLTLLPLLNLTSPHFLEPLGCPLVRHLEMVVVLYRPAACNASTYISICYEQKTRRIMLPL